jgi:hypothetical protein
MIKKAILDGGLASGGFFVPKQIKWDREFVPTALTNELWYGNVPNELKCSRNNIGCFDNFLE